MIAAMNSATTGRILSLDVAAGYVPGQVVNLSRQLVEAKHQIEWFKRQLFGQKSERRIPEISSGQMSLCEGIGRRRVRCMRVSRRTSRH